MELTLAHFISAVSVVIALINFAYTRFNVQSSLNREVGELNKTITALNDTSIRIQVQIDNILLFHNELHELVPKINLFWDIIREHVPKMLIHSGEAYRDTLLMKLSNDTINYQEAIDLQAMLLSDIEHYKRDEVVDPMASLTPLALWALAEKIRRLHATDTS